MKYIYYFIFFLILFSCKKETISSSNDSSPQTFASDYEAIDADKEDEISIDSDELYNGTYCAEVEYYNPNTGSRSNYDLDVEVEDGYLVQIDWPNDGWLDETHFTSEDISSGECSFTSDRGYRYTVTLGEKGGECYSNGYRLINRVNEEVENTPALNAVKKKMNMMNIVVLVNTKYTGKAKKRKMRNINTIK